MRSPKSGNFLRTLATPEPIKDWSLTSLKEKLIKIGAKVVSHGRYVAFQMAEVAIPTANVPGDFAAHRGTAAAATTRASMRRSTVMRSRATDRRSTSKCQEDGQIRPSTKRSGCPRVPVGVRTSRLSSRETGKALIFTPVRESSD
jgi:hypothetical protein